MIRFYALAVRREFKTSGCVHYLSGGSTFAPGDFHPSLTFHFGFDGKIVTRDLMIVT